MTTLYSVAIIEAGPHRPAGPGSQRGGGGCLGAAIASRQSDLDVHDIVCDAMTITCS